MARPAEPSVSRSAIEKSDGPASTIQQIQRVCTNSNELLFFKPKYWVTERVRSGAYNNDRA
jgi:hypothetical protein